MLKVFLVVFTLACAAAGSRAIEGGFIRPHGTKFVNERCEDFIFSGANVWALMEAVAG